MAFADFCVGRERRALRCPPRRARSTRPSAIRLPPKMEAWPFIVRANASANLGWRVKHSRGMSSVYSATAAILPRLANEGQDEGVENLLSPGLSSASVWRRGRTPGENTREVSFREPAVLFCCPKNSAAPKTLFSTRRAGAGQVNRLHFAVPKLFSRHVWLRC